MKSLAKSGKQLAKNIMKILPESLQLYLIRSYLHSKEKTIYERKLPDAITFFITSRCNARCEHCFYWKELNTERDELTLEEIDKIATSMNDGLDSLALTGGEPTLRKDLGEICRIFNERCRTRNIGIASNGLLPERIHDTCKWILKHCKLERLNVQISLDGIERVHDEIRKVPHAFAKAMETIKILNELCKEYTNFSINTALAIQPRNYKEIDAFVEYMMPLNVPMKFLAIRGSNYGTYGLNPNISSEFDPRLEESASISLNVKQLEEIYFKLIELNEKFGDGFWSELDQATMYTTLHIIEEKKRIIPCYAGNLEGIIYSNGDVAICELTKPFENLREADYNFHKIWNSDKANRMRSLARSCACIHSCNLTTALRFQPEILYSTVIGHSLKNRRQRWQR